MLLDYEKRNADFLKAARAAARRELAAGRDIKSLELVREVINSPAPAYYVSAEYVLRRLHNMNSGKVYCQNPLRRAMIREIEQKLNKLKAKNPEADTLTLLEDLLGYDGPGASQFFICPEYGRRLFTGSARRTVDRPHRRRPRSKP